jgi:hypothetical protein
MQTKENLITQLDYIKILIDEDRHGESHDRIEELRENLNETCNSIKDKFNSAQLELPKSLIKTKPNQWIFINQTWVKILSITKQEITFELNKGNTVKSKYTVKKGI